MDALTVILSAHQKAWWPYYAATATAGATLGAYLAYALGKEGEHEALEKRLPRQKAEKIRRIFNRYGLWSIVVPALLPPPFPFSPFPLVAGMMEYSRKKFLIAIGVARGIRYFALAYLGSFYSRQIFGFFHEYYKHVLWTLVGAAVLGAVISLCWIWKRKRRRNRTISATKDTPAKAA
jgi:membrane protein DedA with SNARE-associated domain